MDDGTTEGGPHNYRTMNEILDSALKIADDSLRTFDDDDEEEEEE